MNSILKRLQRVAEIFLFAGLPALLGAAPRCEALTARETARLEQFANRWYRIPTGQSFHLADSAAVDAGCYTKIEFRLSVPAPLLVVWLTPDHKYLLSGRIDSTVDIDTTRHDEEIDLQRRLAHDALISFGAETPQNLLVVFTDFQCPFCRKLASIVSDLPTGYKAGLRVVYRQLPSAGHSWARRAAEFVACSAKQDPKAAHDLGEWFFAKQEELSSENIESEVNTFLASRVDGKLLAACRSERAYASSLDADLQMAIDLGIHLTPTAFLNGRQIAIRSVDDLTSATVEAITVPASSGQQVAQCTASGCTQ